MKLHVSDWCFPTFAFTVFTFHPHVYIQYSSGGKARVLLQRQMQRRESRAAWWQFERSVSRAETAETASCKLNSLWDQIHSGLCGLCGLCGLRERLPASIATLSGLPPALEELQRFARLRSTLPCFAARGCKMINTSLDSFTWPKSHRAKMSLPMRRVFSQVLAQFC